MTTRAIKKLTKVDELKKLEEALKESKKIEKLDEESDDEEQTDFEVKQIGRAHV